MADTFEERAEPVKRAIAAGAHDPVGWNYTSFEREPERKVKPRKPATKLGQVTAGY